MLSTGELDEFGRDVDFVGRVVDSLSAAAAYVILVPAVAMELVLLTGVSKVCLESAIGRLVACHVNGLAVLNTLVVLDPCPHQPTHQALGYARPDAKVQVWPVGPPEQAGIGGLLDLGHLGADEGQLKCKKTCQPLPKGAMPAVARHGVGSSWSLGRGARDEELAGFGTHFADTAATTAAAIASDWTSAFVPSPETFYCLMSAPRRKSS